MAPVSLHAAATANKSAFFDRAITQRILDEPSAPQRPGQNDSADAGRAPTAPQNDENPAHGGQGNGTPDDGKSEKAAPRGHKDEDYSEQDAELRRFKMLKKTQTFIND